MTLVGMGMGVLMYGIIGSWFSAGDLWQTCFACCRLCLVASGVLG
jgi:hypothetical protein